MVVIELTYTAPIEAIDEHLATHREFLQKNYDAGILVASGPQNPRTGGIIIALGTKPVVEKLMHADPFYQHQLANYRFIEFEAVKSCEALRPLLENLV